MPENLTASQKAKKRWERWNAELSLSSKVKGYEAWEKTGERIVRRYRDEEKRNSEQSASVESSARFNILWSNVQTLLPATFSHAPKPLVERRYLDRDPVGRTASVILERCLKYELDNGLYEEAVRMAVLDRFLPGRGVVWCRYAPVFEASGGPASGGPATETSSIGKGEAGTQEERPEEGAQEAAEADERVVRECVETDYIDWQDFRHSASRTWREVWWISKRIYLTKDDATKQFGKKCADALNYNWVPAEDGQKHSQSQPQSVETRAEHLCAVWEIWNRRERRVVWWSKDYTEDVLRSRDDPLKLEGFWPIPRPVYATLTNNSLVPIADYTEYQDQAIELDDLTARITALTRAIKVAGVYNSAVPQLQRILQEGMENQLVPVDNMAEFVTKGGPDGMGHIWLLPVKEMADTLAQLHVARDQAKRTLYEVTGMSDIVRGQAEGPKATATEQRIKGQFASLRLNDMKADVARFARDVIRIMAEIIAEHFDPTTLRLISGYDQYAEEQFPKPAPPAPPAQMAPPSPTGAPVAPPGPMPGGPQQRPPVNGGAPPGPAASSTPGGSVPFPIPPTTGGPPIMLPPMDPEAMRKMEIDAHFAKAVALLRDDKLRGFRIDIETDSIIEPDEQMVQQSRVEMMGMLAQFLPQAVEAGARNPKMRPLLGMLVLWAMRGFKAGRELEGPFEQFIDDLQKEAQNPPPQPPSPEEMKAQAIQQKAQLDIEKAQLKLEADREKFQMQQLHEREKMEMERAMMEMKLQMERERMNIKREENEMDIAAKQQEMTIDAQAAQQQASIDAQAADREAMSAERQAQIDHESMERQAELSRDVDERKHTQGVEMIDAKAKAAQASVRSRPSKGD